MKFNIEINDNTIRMAAIAVRNHYQDEAFLSKIRSVDSYNLTYYSPEMVSLVLRSSPAKLDITIKSYKSINPFSRVIAYADGNIIFVNERKLNLPFLDRVENIYHEMTHMIGFKHAGNYVTKFNLGTVPYLASNIFKNYIKEIKEAQDLP
jgi:hypothetical protein